MSEFALSVVIPTYNRPDLIDAALNSLQTQKTEYSFEVIIQDNSTNLKTQEKISQISNDFNFKINYEKNEKVLPPIQNWKKGIDRSSTQIIKILWDDDWLEPDAIQTFMSTMINSNADAVISGALLVSDKKKYEIYQTNQHNLNANYVLDSITDLEERLPLTPSCSLIKKDLILKAYETNGNLIKCNENAMAVDFVMYYMGRFIEPNKLIKTNDFLVNLFRSNDSITENSNKFALLGCYVSSAYNMGKRYDYKFSKKQLRNIKMLSYLLNRMNLKCLNYLPNEKFNIVYVVYLVKNRVIQKYRMYMSSLF